MNVHKKLFQPSPESEATRERARRKALCKITREVETGDTPVVGTGCLFYDDKVIADWSKFFILTSSKLIPKEKLDVNKYHVEFIKPKPKSEPKTFPLSTIVKNIIYHVSSGLVAIFIDSHSAKLKSGLLKRRSSSVLKDLEPRIGCKQKESQFFFVGEKRYEYVAGEFDWKDDSVCPPSVAILLEEGDKYFQAVGILNFEDNEDPPFVPIWWKSSNVEEILGLPDKPVITNADGEVDIEFTVTWLKAHNNPENLILEYRLEWRKTNSTGSTAVPRKHRKRISDTQFQITGLEYDSVYEVKLFAVSRWRRCESEKRSEPEMCSEPEKRSEQEMDSEPDIRTFKTKTGLPGKPIITNKESEVDKEFTLNWSPPEVNNSGFQPSTYRLEWTKRPLPAGSSEIPRRANTDETHFKITELEYNSEYEVKLFAVNQQGDSEPHVKTFKTKTGLPQKPVITNKEGKVDKEFIMTWVQPEADGNDSSPTYRLEWREKFPTGFLEKQEHGNIVETFFKITGLKYESEYEVKLFAVNKQGESEPDVRMFKTKTGAPDKPTITNKEDEVDVEITLAWSEPAKNSSDPSPTYHLEWKNLTTGKKKSRPNIVVNQFSIDDLEYDTEYEVKLFAVNKQGKSEPDVKTFLTKSAITAYTTALKSSIADQTEFQPKLLSSSTIASAKTEDIFTNLLIQHGRKDLITSDKMQSRTENLKYYGEVSGIPVKEIDEIFLRLSNDQQNPNSILVVGKAGIGKSLFCQKLIRDWAKNGLLRPRENTEIPNLKFVYLLTFRQLNLFENKSKTLKEFLNCSSMVTDNSIIDDVTFEYILKHPKEVMIILDGYDEFSLQDKIHGNLDEEHQNSPKAEMPVFALCSKLIKEKILKGAIVLITSRPDESDKLGIFTFKRYVEIAGFSSEQVREYIEKYFVKSETKKDTVLKHVLNNENLVSFAHVPMLCFLMCFEMDHVLTESGNLDDLPVSVTEIYTKIVNIFELKHSGESEYRKKAIPEDVKKSPRIIENTLKKLSKLASKLLWQKKATFDQSEMEDDFDSGEVEKLKGSGLLHCGQPFRTSSTTITKHFSFTHLTVQEYLAALYFVNDNQIPDGSFSEMVFQFMAGISSEKKNEELMEKLMANVQASFSKNRLLAAKCLSEHNNKEFAKKYIRKHPQAFSDSDNSWSLENVSDVDCLAVSFVLNIVSDVHGEEAGRARNESSQKFEAIKKLKLTRSPRSLPGIKRICKSLAEEHSRVSKLGITYCDLTKEFDVIGSLVSCKLITLNLGYNKITDANVASLCHALKHPRCRLTTICLCANEITDTGFSSLCEVLQHPSCKLTTLFLGGNKITDAGVASLCNALQHAPCGLTALDLWGNRITDASVTSLCEALQHPSCRLYTLNLLGNGISGENMEHLDTFICTVRFQKEELYDLKIQTVSRYSE